VFRHGSSGAWFSEARTRAGARFGTRLMSTTPCCSSAKANGSTRPRRSVFLRKPYLVRQGVGQTSGGGEEPAG